MSFDPKLFRDLFPIFRNNPGLAYLDNAATSQLPTDVITAIVEHLEQNNSNVHRAVYELGARAELMYESTRREIAEYIHANDAEEIIFNSGTTDGLNFIAEQFRDLTPDDEVLLTIQEHHSNILPWQRLRAKIKFVNMDQNGDFGYEDFEQKISSKTKVVAVAQYNNVLGTINPLNKIADLAHRYGALFVVDGAQSLIHGPIDVNNLGCDVFVTSGHKSYGPTGIGFLYIRKALHKQLHPYRVGGGTVDRVFTDRPAIFREPPYVFEAGTQNIVGVAGLRAAVKFLKQINWADASTYLNKLKDYAIDELKKCHGIRVLKPDNQRISIISFIHEKIHSHDIASILDNSHIAVRAGTHCASPLMQALGISGCVRISLAHYNTAEEIDRLAKTLRETEKIFCK